MIVWILKSNDEILYVCANPTAAEDLKSWLEADIEEDARNYWNRHKLNEENYGPFSLLVSDFLGSGFLVEEFDVIV